MKDPEDLSSLIGQIYAAALDPRLWPEVLHQVSAAFEAQLSTFVLVDHSRPHCAVVEVSGFDPELYAQFLERREAEDYWYLPSVGLPAGHVGTGSELIGVEEMHRTPMYQEVSSGLGAEYMVGGVIDNHPNRQALVSFIRGRSQEDFCEDDKRFMRMLLPHLQRAHFIHQRLAEINWGKTAAEQALDDSRYGIVMIDGVGQAFFVNKAGERVLLEADGLTLRYGALRCYDYRAEKALRALIEQARQAGRQEGTAAGGVLRIDRPSGKRSYQVLVSPLNALIDGATTLGRGACVVFVHDPEDRPGLSESALIELYRLSPGEARFCAALFRAGGLEAAAQSLHISRNTAKTHLARIFEKCGASSQAALLRLLAASLAQKD